jgi:hypothetical protein
VWTPALLGLLRPPGTVALTVPEQPVVHPPRGMRGMRVHIAGRGVGAASAVYFGSTAAPLLDSTDDWLTVLVPDVPSEPTVVSLQLGGGSVTLRERFQVYQLPVPSGTVTASPCVLPLGSLTPRIAALAPQQAAPGAVLTVAVPGAAALRDRVEQGNSMRSMGGGQRDLLGLAFSYEPAAPSSTGGGLVDTLAALADRQAPVAEAQAVAAGSFTVQVPLRARSGPVALVVFTRSADGAYGIRECRGAGPDLVVASSAARP